MRNNAIVGTAGRIEARMLGLAALLFGVAILCSGVAHAQGSTVAAATTSSGIQWAWGLATVPFFVRTSFSIPNEMMSREYGGYLTAVSASRIAFRKSDASPI